ncbi:hypothetical protein L211DRAFT_464550 [Terfezia boudieri ATCC MYA-4762]|uniref:Uncharacterized protein n=1 Tax=Terfezia boudieri ATCC MYA-4762 TaxID=1051890 RepID=A0A3N4M1N4_9PEZI|nr:hypothetical protein L211DRAFT_464550 [Terfezia boudieri ATCC MYA-4762]
MYQHHTANIFNPLQVSPNYGVIAIQDCCGILGSMWYDITLFVRPIKFSHPDSTVLMVITESPPER